MDCPTCGLINPPETAQCDCGYDFTAGKAADLPGWPIQLAWTQKIAAYWSISWPALASSALLVFLITKDYSVDRLLENQNFVAIGSGLFFFLIQALLTRRLVRKDYRTFRIYVI